MESYFFVQTCIFLLSSNIFPMLLGVFLTLFDGFLLHYLISSIIFPTLLNIFLMFSCCPHHLLIFFNVALHPLKFSWVYLTFSRFFQHCLMSLNISLALFGVILASLIVNPKKLLNVIWSFPNIAQYPLVIYLVLLNIFNMFSTSLVIANDFIFLTSLMPY
jgi:hypothetical protein